MALHVDYVTDPVADPGSPLEFLVSALSDPAVAVPLLAGGLAVATVVLGYLLLDPAVPDLAVARSALAEYEDLVPWMLRLGLGLPLVGAGFQGYLFAPVVTFDAGANPGVRVGLIALGFLLLFGLATRIVAAAGLIAYAAVVAVHPDAVIAMEYVPGFLALALLGSGRPSADDVLASVSAAPGTLYGRIDPVWDLESRVAAAVGPSHRYVPTVLRIGTGATFVYLGAVQKLGDPARSLSVVAKYDLAAVVPVPPEAWVLGAALVEVAVGLSLIVGLLTRASAGAAFLLFTVTLFGLPDDPVLAHVSLYALVSAILTLGAGPLSLDARLAADRPDPAPGGVPADD